SSRRFALRIAAARQERAEPTALEGHFAPAILAVLGLAFLVVQLRSHILDEIAIGISRAPQKESVAADAFQQLAFAALLALPAGWNSGLIRNHFLIGLRQVDDKLLPELLDRITPGQLAFFDFVQLFFQSRGEGDIKNVVETLDQ